ncbi:TBCC-domain-containing protein [Auriscalpium vulgare]|uniref:TBCC-domain-containing protein n=1 Tax=Auriscalpium vulgare TaxID=40419 RepID=A0ACB8S2A7_9AGAM|nr:TBCC-domain-containing protein [Auriscalpium vulgare]
MPEAVTGLGEAAEFYTQFQATRSALTVTLEAQRLQMSQSSTQALASDVAKLRKSLVDATTILTAYDQRQCEEQMSALEALLAEIRASSAQKPKFSFKRKAAQPAGIQPASMPTRTGNEAVSAHAVPPQLLPSTFHTLSSHSHRSLSSQDIPTLRLSDSSQSGLTIADLDHCLVDLRPAVPNDTAQVTLQPAPLTALHIRNVLDSILVLPPLKGSVILHNVTRCVVVVGCHQFRMHTSTDVHVYLYIPSGPIIEDCSRVAFAPYPAFLRSMYPDGHFPLNNTYSAVQDFSHIRPTPSPNWSLLEDKAVVDLEAILGLPASDLNFALPLYLPKTSPQ